MRLLKIKKFSKSRIYSRKKTLKQKMNESIRKLKKKQRIKKREDDERNLYIDYYVKK